MFTPYYIAPAGKHVQLANCRPETLMKAIGDVSVIIAPFVKAVVEQPSKTTGGAIVLASTEAYGAGEMLQMWARAQGNKAQFMQVSGAAFRELWPLWGEEMGAMMEIWDEYGDASWNEPDGSKVLTKEDLSVSGFQTLEEAYRGLKLFLARGVTRCISVVNRRRCGVIGRGGGDFHVEMDGMDKMAG